MQDLTSFLGILVQMKIVSVDTGPSTLNFSCVALSVIILRNA